MDLMLLADLIALALIGFAATGAAASRARETETPRCDRPAGCTRSEACQLACRKG